MAAPPTRITMKKILGKIYRKTKKIINAIPDINTIRLVSTLDNSNKTIISLPTIDWNITLYQRPQHLALELSKLTTYIYGTLNFQNFDVNGTKHISNNLLITNKYEYLLNKLNRSTILLLSTQQLTTIDQLKKYKQSGHKIIYDYVDEIHEQISGSPEMAKFLNTRHQFIKDSQIVDLVVCTATKLYQEMLQSYPLEKVILAPNGVNYQHFQIKKTQYPFDFKPPIVGYYGALAKWIDYDLINQVAKDNPQWQVVLIGVDYDHSMEKIDKKLKNIHYLGPKPYEELPQYGIHFDVAIIPFVKGEIAKATSPLKFFEYMALHKPTVVTSDLVECSKYPEVFTANSAKDFSAKIKSALKIKDESKWISQFDKIAKDNTWEKRAKQIFSHLR